MRTVVLLGLMSLSIVACKTNRTAASAPDAAAASPARPRTGMCGLDESREICNGLDDDCNGAVDDNARCPAGQHCVAARCQ